MGCGIVKITGVPDADIGMAITTAMGDDALKAVQEDAGGGLWNLTIFYPDCTDGGDPVPVMTGAYPNAPTTHAGSAATTPAAFIKAHLATAQAVKQKFTIPVSVTLAQSAIETGWGCHVVGNAYFGVKKLANEPFVEAATNEVINGQTVVVRAKFSSYADYAAAAVGYGNFLTTQPRYKKAFEHKDDPKAFAQAVAAAGYATGPGYGAKLLAIMDGQKLLQYDA